MGANPVTVMGIRKHIFEHRRRSTKRLRQRGPIVPIVPSMRGFPAANDLSEAALYLITLLSAPWLLRQGKHIRVDILLKAIPAQRVIPGQAVIARVNGIEGDRVCFGRAGGHG